MPDDDLFDRIDKYQEDHLRDGPDPWSEQGMDKWNKTLFNFEKAKLNYNKDALSKPRTDLTKSKDIDKEFEQTMAKARQRAEKAPKATEKQLAARRKLNSSLKLNDNTEMQMTELDAGQLTDLVSVLHPLNSDAMQITRDLDSDLVTLHDNDRVKYGNVIAKGEKSLASFDKRARDYNVQTPKRDITEKLNEDARKRINDLPDFSDDNSVSLDDDYSNNL